MRVLIAQRLALGVLTLFVASVLIFLGTEVLPGDLASALLKSGATPENVAALRLELGLDRPMWVRFGAWLWGALQFDFGHSLANGANVRDQILPRLHNTLFLAAYTASLAVPLAVTLGLFAAVFHGRFYDRLVGVVGLMAISMPEYFLAYVLIKYVAVESGWFPSLAEVAPEMGIGERLYVTTLPMLTLVFVIMAHMMRMTRASVLSVMTHPYVEMAILKGLPKWRVVVEHALPNAWAPIVNVISLNLAHLVVGVVVVETVFVYPGLGQLMVDAVSKHDVPVVQACGLIFAGVFVMLNLVADVLAILSNPRLRYRG